MAPTRYSLHYEDYSEHMLSRFGKLLQMQSLVDMTLMCNSHTLRVHKAVLAACSVYFQEVLQKQNGEPLIILKMRFSVLKCLVEFMYCGKTQCAEENLDELVSAAQFLKIKGLAKVTKEDLGITSTTELPVFTPPVVINRPPQPMFDSQAQQQDNVDPKPPPPQAPVMTSNTPVTSLGMIGRPNKDQDTIVRIPFDIETGNSASMSSGYVEGPPRPKRGKGPRNNNTRAFSRVAGAWESGGALSRAAGRALLRREQDSRKAIHQLKHLQSRHMQDYMAMEQVSLSHAVNSICGTDPPPPHYLNMDNDLMYMDQGVPSNVLDPSLPSYSKEPTIGNETITSSYSTATSEASNPGISNAMSQYVNALKNAGLPTDLPILFESGDGSYINVNEQVLLDMVQSSEIQYEVIEQPNIIEKVADPSEIKSIDDLSKSIERGEMMMEGYTASNYDKPDQYSHDAINSLSSILPDNLESFGEQQNFVVLDPALQETSNMDSANANDFSCIDGDMQFFTKSMSDDVKKYYAEPHLHDARDIDQLCPTSTMDASFSMSLLDAKSSLSGNMSQQYNPLNPEDMRRNEDCYDFGLPLKEDALDCLMAATPKRPDDDENLVKRAQEREEIIQDLMNIEKTISQKNTQDKGDFTTNIQDFDVYNEQSNIQDKDKNVTFTSNELNEWDTMKDETDSAVKGLTAEYNESVIDLTDSTKNIQLDNDFNKENESPDVDMGDERPDVGTGDESPDVGIGDLIQNDIPFAVGLLPLKQVQPNEDGGLQKRKHDTDDLLDSVDAKCLKRKVKYKKL